MYNKPSVLFYDLETKPNQAWVWQPGKQYISHKQLVKGHSTPEIICAAYAWNDGKPAKSLDWDYDKQDSTNLVRELDELILSADIVIGKNNTKFDNKVLNAVRMLKGLPGMPHWVKYTDDLETHMRRHFRLPSQSLDYISNQLGYGGKIKMEMQDWIDIVEKNENGMKSFKKMIKYNKKDVEDTRDLWNRLAEHFEPKFNMCVYNNTNDCCRHCGSSRIQKRGIRYSTSGQRQDYQCNDCRRYGSRRINKTTEGRML